MLTIPCNPSPRPPLVLAVVTSPHGSVAIPRMRDTLVPRASHPTVTSDACPGRIPAAERRVESCNTAVSTDSVAISTATSTASCRTSRAELSRALYIVLTSGVQGKTPDCMLHAARACYAGPAMASPERLPVPDRELSRPALVLAQRFVQRWDLHARQLDHGSYVCVYEPLNVGHLLDHLRGEITLGAYLLDQDSQAKQLYIIAGRSNLQPRPMWSRYRPAFPR
jgi:hypothetical protein